VHHSIVEGEPGIFPDPVARVMRAIGGWFGRRKGSDDDAPRDVGGTDDDRDGRVAGGDAGSDGGDAPRA
jgi:hypothetical protein